MSIKAITLWQPYASLCRPEAKTIETRGRATRWRGPLLVHASNRWGIDQRDALDRARTALARLGLPLLPDPLPRGCVVAACRLADCRPMADAPDPVNAEFGGFGPGRFGWPLAGLIALPEPVRWRGTQGLWTVPDELERLVRAALGERAGVLDAIAGPPSLFPEPAGESAHA